MKKILILFLIVTLGGCAYATEDIKNLVKDPHYAGYQNQLDDLERSYLNGGLTYPDYLERKRQIDEKYTKEVQERDRKIHQTSDY